MRTATQASALKVQAALGPDFRVLEFEASTRTAVDAAAAVGCEVGAIVKSLVFRAEPSRRAVLILASGATRVNEAKAAEILGEKLGRADADFVRRTTGFAIGGVPPVGHLSRLEALIDEGLFAYALVWAAAGTPNAVFAATPLQLLQLTGGRRVSVAA